MKNDYSYHFDGINVHLGNAVVSVSGTAKYQIEDLGSSDADSTLIAYFYEAKIRDYKMKNENQLAGFTEQDRQAMAEMVLEILNDDYELCTNLPINTKE